MNHLTVDKIDSYRKQGMRPDVVGCFVNNRKVLMLYKKEHNLWQLPQGGIDNKETPDIAIAREMGEELGNPFVEKAEEQVFYLGEDKVEFPKSTQDVRELFTDAGEKIKMKGKKYFFLALQTPEQFLDLSGTEFDGYQWLNYDDAIMITSKIYQSGKRRITEKAVKLLKEYDLID